MFPKDLRFHLFTVLFYAAGVTLLGRHFQPAFLLFWLGATIGTGLLYLDPLVSVYLASSESVLAQEVKKLLKEKRFKELALTALTYHLRQEQPLLHSALFQIALTVLGFYIVTSSSSLFGAGLLVGMTLHLIKDEAGKWGSPQELNKMLFWNIHRQISEKEQKIYLGVIWAAFSLETIFLL